MEWMTNPRRAPTTLVNRSEASSGAVSTDILHLPARVAVTAADRLTSTNGRNVFK
jgi:hypothetical protein